MGIGRPQWRFVVIAVLVGLLVAGAALGAAAVPGIHVKADGQYVSSMGYSEGPECDVRWSVFLTEDPGEGPHVTYTVAVDGVFTGGQGYLPESAVSGRGGGVVLRVDTSTLDGFNHWVGGGGALDLTFTANGGYSTEFSGREATRHEDGVLFQFSGRRVQFAAGVEGTILGSDVQCADPVAAFSDSRVGTERGVYTFYPAIP
jgi:hypothetical protein